MDTSIIIDEIKVTMEDSSESSSRSCFVVFSSHEDHIEIVIDCIESVFDQAGIYDVRRLDKHLKSGDSQYGELRELLETCCFGVVILDGFRPNVLFEYGILKGLQKPCIVLVEKNATADVFGYFEKESDRPSFKPEINMDRHFSDVKDRFYAQYDKNDPKGLRAIIEEEYEKLGSEIEEEFLHMLFPNRDFVEKELTSHLTVIAEAYDAKKEEIREEKVRLIRVAGDNIIRIAKDASVELPYRFYCTYAKIFERSKNYDEALLVYDEALAVSGEKLVFLMRKALILKSKSEYDDAMKMMDSALKYDEENESIWHNKALVEIARGDHAKAKKYYKKAVSFNEECSLVHFHYGILLYREDNDAKALTQFNKALKIEPENTEYQLWKAKALCELGRMPQAVKLLEAIVEADPTQADAWYTLGGVEEDVERAIELLNKALDQNPEHAGALCALAAATAHIGKEEDALILFERVKLLCQNGESCSQRVLSVSRILADTGKADEALASLEEFLVKFPDDYDVRLEQGVRFAYSEKYTEAFLTFGDLQKEFPERGTPSYYTACTYGLKGEAEKAVEYLDASMTIEPSLVEGAKTHSDFDTVRDSEVFKTWLFKVS